MDKSELEEEMYRRIAGGAGKASPKKAPKAKAAVKASPKKAPKAKASSKAKKAVPKAKKA